MNGITFVCNKGYLELKNAGLPSEPSAGFNVESVEMFNPALPALKLTTCKSPSLVPEDAAAILSSSKPYVRCSISYGPLIPSVLVVAIFCSAAPVSSTLTPVLVSTNGLLFSNLACNFA